MTLGCKSEPEREAQERENENEARQELEEDLKDAPQTAEEMKDEAGVHSMERDQAESPEELRKKLDLHPEEEPE